ncbi:MULTISPECIES: aspartate--tRNA ligase [unclassified Sphingopyxis]|uniref:aspartate--tRNA ligase n=1 Tax=unclassified Sphingopyxis TaxID=2614943 RepID=UPI00072FC801|nr:MULTISPECIES: aspartate--tRNA ligase [unclassified Sphingopyxis]KTE27773.1 aspartyl-tRNA synthetase [Sphingopyxis sp. H057]KTE55846.1 aspartyl-tRNA synthetase [Sphingopyxis sp. H073]KTE56488.1 aspartyl-tRNA synthetase [Sphingopyxis sp. H107]KTE57273.1 aspartyl-tRNA synthetase [Sphingopyxis sp. H071]KTE65308.1 aspartyl-tRNA synthetase [Sphingopyxis sp. H100]
MHAYRTHTCADLRAANVGEDVRLSGWVHRTREHANVLFVDLRDHYGITQIVVETGSDLYPTVNGVGPESVLTFTGKVAARSPETLNPKLATGEIEIYPTAVAVQSAAERLPLPVFGEAEYPEEIRLTNRFLDLRRERLHKNIVLRSNVISSLRRRMIDQGFTEFQTPILTASSPEGARDYLVPSRVHPGKFYALPQAPQMFKQLLMVAGFDRYFQIAPCFRDEDARADRSPGEFYQLDFEMSFVTQDDVFAAIEPVLHGVFEEFADFDGKGRTVSPLPFKRIPYRESMLKYGSDKPDLRNPLLVHDVGDFFKGSGFGRFASMVEEGQVVRAVAAPETHEKSRKFFDEMNSWAQSEGFPGLGYATQKDGVFGGPIANNHGQEGMKAIADAMGLGPNDGIFFAAGVEAKAAKLAGLARTRVAEQLDLIDKSRFEFCWIVDFPMFEADEETGKIDFSHNPFSMPQGEMDALTTKDPLDILAYQYDIVCNGVELSSGAIRNHRPDIMYKAFEIAGYSQQDVDTNFAGMINAFKFGAPPHGGSAPGVDRIVMLLADEPNIREVIVFPMTQKAEDLMMGAPAPVSEKQLKELHIRLVDGPKN